MVKQVVSLKPKNDSIDEFKKTVSKLYKYFTGKELQITDKEWEDAYQEAKANKAE